MSLAFLKYSLFISTCSKCECFSEAGTIFCDGENRRLRFTNFGNAVDIDPPRVELDNATLELDAPGSIANTFRPTSSP